MEENLKQFHTNLIKITLYGPESTGKTTLAKQLAEHYQTVWTPEYAREYLQEKWNNSNQTCTQEDLIPIAIGQIQLENESLVKANGILFSDTNLMVTKVFSDIYYGTCDKALRKAAKKHKYDLFLLTDIDIPWEKDDLRDRPHNREKTLAAFEQALIDFNKPYIKLSGTKERRFQKAVALIDALIQAKSLGFNSFDLIQLQNHQIQLESVEKQISFMKKGINFANLDRIANINDGIKSITPEQALFFATLYDEKKEQLKLKKFVPASGAASRMFKFLNEFLNEFNYGEETINAYINRKKAKNLSLFLIGKEKLPFYKEIFEATKQLQANFDQLDRDTKDYLFIKTMLSKSHFDYANKPKGILPFHKYSDHIATPIEEHLNEAAYYASSKGKAHVHFTVSSEHQTIFEEVVAAVKPKIEQKNGIEISVNYSFQNQSTDSVSVNLANDPFRDDNNRLLFRPGGHGALIENLNALDADLVFIKNIDNVLQNHKETIALYKKALAGILLEKQQKIFYYLKELESDLVTKETLSEVVSFIRIHLNMIIIEEYSKYTKENKIEYLQMLLNRPIRVCGMVKNEGEPGGGPFWVRDSKGSVFLQIVEASQIDTEDQNQVRILDQSAYFNPVDLVCGIKNHKGTPFDLTHFVDNNSGFIVFKNHKGKEIKAYELPGLWNGAMAKWLTIFVEIPLITFNPVKTVNDLLKPAHQPQ
jgi:nicotinamide riboside kinase